MKKDYIERYWVAQTDAKANSDACVCFANARFTMLTDRLIRMEYDLKNEFEDRPTLSIWFRNLEVPKFTKQIDGDVLTIETDYLVLKYKASEECFNGNNLTVYVKETEKTYTYGMWEQHNLGGTARTLDGVNGSRSVEPGLLSKDGFATVSDTEDVIINEDGWVEARFPNDDGKERLYRDEYFFGYGLDYRQALSDFTKITGKSPMFPKYVLGNWWSRYHEYDEAELTELIEDFKKNDVPLSVCVIDMDWHLIENDYHGGWTGYTWNKKLFPDPARMIKFIHDNGLKTSMNLHPADGVAPHEEYYPQMAELMGVDPASKKTIEFDITDPQYANGYFKYMHHPHEDMGVDFWWMDWQQGEITKIKGLDPLRWINHLHFYDSGRDGKKRPFVFSRFGGYGSHRYPIGFSGDTIVTWESLKFQPYFTNMASNVAYGWWSHDIGGHMGGIKDPELYLRWVQYGVFTPILRLHSSKSSFQERRPFKYEQTISQAAGDALRLRHKLIPYIYSMMWRNYTTDQPLVSPMYFDYPKEELAYSKNTQYMYGTELLVSPVVDKIDPAVGMSRIEYWLPEGQWFNFFNGEVIEGGRNYADYVAKEEIPVLAKAGAIVPMSKEAPWGTIENATDLQVTVFPGASNAFELYEDDGETVDYKDDKYSITRFETEYADSKMKFTINKVQGCTDYIPASRNYSLAFRAVSKDVKVIVLKNGVPVDCEVAYCDKKETWHIEVKDVATTDMIEVVFEGEIINPRNRTEEKLLRLLTAMGGDSDSKNHLYNEFKSNKDLDVNDFSFVRKHIGEFTSSQMQAIIETIKGETIL